MRVHVHGSLCAAEFPEGGGFPHVGKRKLAALVEDAPDDHGQRVLYPAFGGLGIKRAIQPDVFRQRQQRGRGAELFGEDDLESIGVALGQDVVAQSGLNIEQCVQGDAGNAAVLVVLDLAVQRISEGGAENADGGFPVALDFEVDWMPRFDG